MEVEPIVVSINSNMNIINNINAFFICEKAFVISMDMFILKITKFASHFI